MKLNVVWYEEAVEELEEIYNFYFLKSPTVAVSIYNSILSETRYLQHFPNIASVEPLLADKKELYRSLVTKDGLFKIIYYVEDENVYITRVVCCRADPQKLKGN